MYKNREKVIISGQNSKNRIYVHSEIRTKDPWKYGRTYTSIRTQYEWHSPVLALFQPRRFAVGMYVGRGRPAGVNDGGDESDPLALLEDDNARAIRVATSVEPMSANERSERCDVPVEDLPTHRPPYGSRTTRRTGGTRSGGPPPPGQRVSPRGGLRRLRRRRTPARTRPLAVLGLGLVDGHRNPARPKRECGRHSRRSGAGDEDACIPVAHVRTHSDGD